MPPCETLETSLLKFIGEVPQKNFEFGTFRLIFPKASEILNIQS